MNKIYSTILIILFSLSLSSQTVDLGFPIGWKGKLNSKNIPNVSMSGYNQALMDSEDAVNDISKDRPWRFGYKYDDEMGGKSMIFFTSE